MTLAIEGKPLTEKAQRFCEVLVTEGCSNVEAAKKAGYSDKSAHTAAWRLVNDQRVLDTVHQLTKRSLAMSGVRAARKMVELSTGARSERVQMEASKDLLDRAGFSVSEETSVTGIAISIDLSE